MAGRMDDKVALVTGASSGIGRATALAFSREGARVVVAARRVKESEETVALVEAEGGEATFVQTDVTQSEQVEELVRSAVTTFGRLDCAFNNAGIEGPEALAADYREDDWDTVMAVNLKGVWLCMKHEIRQMLDQGEGVIVNTSSIAGLTGLRDGAAYVASKHGVEGLTKAAALEYAHLGIRINAVAPGVIQTGMVERIHAESSDAGEWLTYRKPIARLGTPQEVAEAVVWLCSDAASYVVGHSLVVDGGIVPQSSLSRRPK